jgi:hypothetical protein
MTLEPRMYMEATKFDLLNDSDKMLFLYCPDCQRFYNCTVISTCGCKLGVKQ